MNISLKKRLIVCFVGMLLTLCFHYFISEQIDFVTYLDGNYKIQDYAYYIIIAKAFWFEGFGNIYEIYFHQQALSVHIGAQIYYVMPLGITPIALVIWFPFAYIALFSMSLSYTLWSAFSLGVLFISIWNVFRYASQLKKLALLPIALSFVTLFSLHVLLSIYGGQTSVLAAGLFVYLVYIMHKTTTKSQSDNRLLIVLLIFMLGIKPPHIALALGLLMIYGRLREAVYSVALILVVFIGLTPMLSVEWITSYLKILPMYAQKDIPEIYAWSIVLETMNIFRSAYRSIIGENIAILVSFVVTYGVYLSVVGVSILSKIRGKSLYKFSPLKVTKEQLFVLLVASYLLFAPYAGGYEDILFLPIFVTVLLYGNTPPLTSFKSLTLIFILFIILLHTLFPSNKPLWLFWLLKALILGYMLYFCRFIPLSEIGNVFHRN
jgi:hypothetical protein